jgi:hypothetical protein
MNIAEKLAEKFNAIKKIMLAVEEPTPPAPVPPIEPVKMAMEDYTLADGTVLSIDKLEVGGNALIGELAAPDASYTLPTGDEITVVGGLITEFKPKEQPAPAVESEMAKQVVAMSSHIKTLETKQTSFEVLATKFEAQEKKIEALNKANKELLAAIELMANESKVAPLEKPKSFNEMTNFERLKHNRGEL